MIDPFIVTNPDFALELGLITKEEYDAIVNPAAPEEMQTEPAQVEETVTIQGTSSPDSDDSVIVINGKTYTKSELEKVLKNL